MRYLIMIIVLCNLSVYGESSTLPLQCHYNGNLVSQSYADTVFKDLTPTEFPNIRTLIQISVVIGNYHKIVLQTDGKTYDLYDGIVDPNIYAQLIQLNNSCQLPLNPSNAKSAVKIEWKHYPLKSIEFENIHSDYIKALTEFIMNINHRYTSLIKSGNLYVPVHAAVYTIIYDNHTEHIVNKGYDVEDMEGRTDPLVEWAKKIKKMIEDKSTKVEAPEITD